MFYMHKAVPLQVVDVAKAEGGANLTIQMSFIYKLPLSCYLQVTIL